MRRAVRRVLVIISLVLGLAGVALADGPVDETPRRRTHEILSERPSGFWTSNRPAKTPYRWRLLGIGVVLAGGTGVMMWRMVKRANAERDARG
jgi:hypothetical protein